VAWISCDGENPADVENMGPISYLPQRGFRANQFSTEKDSVDPLIAIQFEDPKSEIFICFNNRFLINFNYFSEGIVVVVQCKMWTQNSQDKITFELMIE
jgi:hypothetical protein